MLKVYKNHFYPTLVKNEDADQRTDKVTYRVACTRLKIIEISLFVTEICPKNHQILGDFSFFPYNKLTGIETDNVPRLKKLKTRCFECIRMYIDGKKCQDLYDFFARKPSQAHGL